MKSKRLETTTLHRILPLFVLALCFSCGQGHSSSPSDSSSSLESTSSQSSTEPAHTGEIMDGIRLFDVSPQPITFLTLTVLGDPCLEESYVPLFLVDPDVYEAAKERDNLPDLPEGFFEEFGLLCWLVSCDPSYVWKLDAFSFLSVCESSPGLLTIETELGAGHEDAGSVEPTPYGYTLFLGIDKEVFASFRELSLTVYDRSTFANDWIRDRREELHYHWTVDESRIIRATNDSRPLDPSVMDGGRLV